MLAAVAGLMIAAASTAFDGPQRVVDWADKLQLSAEQEKRIDDIQAGYQRRFEELRETNSPAWGKPQDDSVWLQERQQVRDMGRQMRADMQAVLTTEQRQKAVQLVRAFHVKMTTNLIQRMTRTLKLTEDQKQQFADGVLRITSDHDWPVDHEQHETARIRMETLMAEVLTPEQLEEVKASRREQLKRWPKPRGIEGWEGRMAPSLLLPPEREDCRPEGPRDAGPEGTPDEPGRHDRPPSTERHELGKGEQC